MCQLRIVKANRGVISGTFVFSLGAWDMNEISDRVAKVATVFTHIDFAITQSFLEGHGIVVVDLPTTTITNFGHFANAMGGVPVRVPLRQAQAAINLLLEADRGDHEIAQEKPELEPATASKPKNFLGRIGEVLWYVFFGSGTAAPPYKGRIVHGHWKHLDQHELM